MDLIDRLRNFYPPNDLMREAANRIEALMGRGPAKSHFVPESWKPNPIMERTARVAPGVDRDLELHQFRLHEFANPRSDWDRAWVQWLGRAKPCVEGKQKATTSYAESKHPALVTERTNETRKFGQ